jgi:hypothetical protein
LTSRDATRRAVLAPAPGPTAVFGAGERDKGERKNELARGEGIRDDATGYSSGIARSISKTIKNSSDGGDTQDYDSGKGKHVEAVGDHTLHI